MGKEDDIVNRRGRLALKRNMHYKIHLATALLTIVAAYVVYFAWYLPFMKYGKVNDDDEAYDKTAESMFRVYFPVSNIVLNLLFVLFVFAGTGISNQAIDNKLDTSLLRYVFNVLSVWIFVIVVTIGTYAPLLLHKVAYEHTSLHDALPPWAFALLCGIVGMLLTLLVVIWRLRYTVYAGVGIAAMLSRIWKPLLVVITASGGFAALATMVDLKSVF